MCAGCVSVRETHAIKFSTDATATATALSEHGVVVDKGKGKLGSSKQREEWASRLAFGIYRGGGDTRVHEITNQRARND